MAKRGVQSLAGQVESGGEFRQRRAIFGGRRRFRFRRGSTPAGHVGPEAKARLGDALKL
jgi:hypothetical protein